MKVLVVGGAGYIGSHMVKRLHEGGCEAVTLDNLGTGHRDAVLHGAFAEGDMGDAAFLGRLFAAHRFDAVMHFGAWSQVQESVDDPARYWRNNVAGTLVLLDAMVAAGPKLLVFSSTAAVYGEPLRSPIDEGHPQLPLNPYGRTKLAVERALADYDRAYGLKSVCLRYFNAAGADPAGLLGERHDPETHLLPRVLQAASGRIAGITVNGRDYDTPDGTCIRDYVHVSDLCEAHWLALQALRAGAGSATYNLGNGQGFSVQQVIDTALAVTGRPIAVRDGPRRAGDPARLVADSSRAKAALGWQPRFGDLRTIVEHAWRWEQKMALAEAAALHAQGMAAARSADFAAAASRLEAAAALAPGHAGIQSDLGVVLRSLGKRREALEQFDKAIAADPGHAEAHSNKGIVLAELGRRDEALAGFTRAIELAPARPEGYSNRAKVLADAGQLEPALRDSEAAVRLAPGSADAHNNLGVALHKAGRHAAAAESFGAAIRLRPAYAEAHNNLGAVWRDLGRIDAAIASYDDALRAQPGYPSARWNKGLALLLGGRLAEGWPLFEARWERGTMARPGFTQPLWLGAEPVEGRTILLHAEQGLGDTIQFCRYAPLVAARGARVLLQVQPPLAALLAGMAGVEVLAKGAPLPPFSLQCPLLSLPLAFGTTEPTIPSPGAYLQADEARQSVWRERIGPGNGRRRFGLVWAGNARHPNDGNRSIALASILPWLPAGIEFIGLQKGAPARVAGLRNLGAELDDFADTAALCSLLDGVVSVDTSVAHLAAALGRPTWVLLPFAPDWRWQLERTDSPWYASMQLLRQRAVGDWGGPLAALAQLA